MHLPAVRPPKGLELFLEQSWGRMGQGGKAGCPKPPWGPPCIPQGPAEPACAQGEVCWGSVPASVPVVARRLQGCWAAREPH